MVGRPKPGKAKRGGVGSSRGLGRTSGARPSGRKYDACRVRRLTRRMLNGRVDCLAR
jgi:hypothetical protein